MLFVLSLCISIRLALGGGLVWESYPSRRIRVEEHRNGFQIKATNEFQPTQYLWADSSMFNDLDAQAVDCSTRESDFCMTWGDKASFKITKISEPCERFDWNTSLNKPLSVSFSLKHAQLYGGTERNYQTWPIQKSVHPMRNVSYVTHADGVNQPVLERYWLFSTGHYVYVDETVPLFVSLNATTLTLTAALADPYIRSSDETALKFVFCHLENVKAAHRHAIAHVFQKPIRVPDFRMVQYPIWSTWVAYYTNVSEENVLKYADAITKNGYPNSALEIDDSWETCYGSFTFDRKKFPDMKRLVSVLKSRGFRVTLWIHPFVNVDCEPTFSLARDSGYLVKSRNGSVRASWWNGVAGAIDFTNPEAAKWWTTRLKKLKNATGLDSFKFDAGEMSYVPQVPVYARMSDDHPDTYIKAYVKTANQFGDMIEIRTARGVQRVSPFVRMLDRETSWSGFWGLDTLIPTLLQMNIVGYPYVLPDMIGGNGGGTLTEELYVRWMQVNVFMPAMQFSLPPWNLGNRSIEITKKFIDLHASYAKRIYNLMKKASSDGTPVNRPLWWIDPEDKNTFTIDSEFMLGEDILVAPITKQGAVSRDIYLPRGKWKDENNAAVSPIQGPILLRNYKADLDILPYFTRLNYETCGSSMHTAQFYGLMIPVLLLWKLG